MTIGRVLVAEDNQDDFEVFSHTLKRFPVEIVHARSGTDAQRILRRDTNFRAVFIDLHLPCMDGLTLVRWVKDQAPELPIVILSGVEEERARAKSLDVGAIFVFCKPYNSSDNQAVLNLLDVTDAIYTKARRTNNWRTNVAGIGTMAGAVALWFSHEHTVAVTMFMAGAGLLCAQDSTVFAKLIEKPKKE